MTSVTVSKSSSQTRESSGAFPAMANEIPLIKSSLSGNLHRGVGGGEEWSEFGGEKEGSRRSIRWNLEQQYTVFVFFSCESWQTKNPVQWDVFCCSILFSLGCWKALGGLSCSTGGHLAGALSGFYAVSLWTTVATCMGKKTLQRMPMLNLVRLNNDKQPVKYVWASHLSLFVPVLLPFLTLL